MSILGFELDWFDPLSELTHNLFLKYFVDDNTIEILGNKTTFLKRIYYPDVKLEDLYIGNSISVHNRLYSIKGYANKYTIDYMKTKESRFLSFVSMEDLPVLPEAIVIASRYGLVLGRVFTYSPGMTLVEFVGVSGKNYDVFVSEASRIIDIRAASNTDIRDALATAPLANIPEGCTLALLKPHILRSHKTGEVLSAIQSRGFVIQALFAFHITPRMAEEFFDAYRGIFSDYAAMIDNFCSGPVLAIAISHPSSYDTVSDFREFAGPTNPKLAKVLRPESLRAQFGSGMLDNVLHCTDLPEDGEMECRYLFETLASIK